MLKSALIEPVGGHGGMHYYDYGLAMGLGNSEIMVHYYTSTQTKVLSYPNVHTHLCFKKVWDTQNKFLRLYYMLKGYKFTFDDCAAKGITIAHFQFFDLSAVNFLVMLLAARYKFKKVLTLHDVSSFKGKDSGLTERYILKQFDAFIVHNQLSYDELILKIRNHQKISIIPHGNYLPFVDELPYRIDLESPLRLLFFGQIKKVKGLEILLEALGKLKSQNVNISLCIAGKVWHDSLERYEALVRDYNLADIVTAYFRYVPDEEVTSLFQEADIVVLPYKKIYQSGVLLLSMSYGRVVLTSDLPAFSEIIEDGVNGFKFKSENVDDLVRVLSGLQKDKYKLPDIRNNASALLRERFDWKLIGRKTKEIYTALAG